MQDRPARALQNLPRADGERGIDSAGRRWLFTRRVPTGGQDQRPGAVLGSAYPPRLENGCGEPSALFAELDRSTSDDRSGGGRTEISGLASVGCARAGSSATGAFHHARRLTRIDGTTIRTVLS